MNRTVRVRLGLVAVASLLAMLLSIQPGRSQPGGFRGGRPFGPPTMPGPPSGIGGITGISGRPPGFSGIGGQPPGISGMSGIGGRPPGIPEIPRPSIPQPPTGMGGMGGMGGGMPIYTWTCGRCGRVLGSGPTPPATAYCSFCRATNTIPGPGGALPPGGGLQPPATVGPAAPPPEMNPAATPGGPQLPVFESTPDVPRSSRHNRVVYAIIIALGVLLLLGIGIVLVIVTLVKTQKSRPRRRPRRRYRDDD